MGQKLLGFTSIFLNVILSIVVGLTLNIVSVRLYRSYVRERRSKEEAYARVAYNTNQATTSNLDEIQVVVVTQAKRLTQKEKNENKSEKNMFNMALTMSSLSVVSRVLLIFVIIYFYFFSNFSSTLILYIVNALIYIVLSISSIFIFYFFNKMFREEFGKKLFSPKEKSNQTTNTSGRNQKASTKN